MSDGGQSVPNGSVELDWADGTYVFNIAKVKQVLELEAKCGAGVGTIHSRLLSGLDMRAAVFFFNDFRETLRLGLIGGGMSPPDALKLVRAYVDERPWAESIRPALVVISAALVGVEGDNNSGKKAQADRTETTPG